MTPMHVFVSTIETGATLDAAGAVDDPLTTVAVDRLTALQRAAGHVLQLATVRHYDDDQVPAEENPYVCPELHDYATKNPLTEDQIEDAFELEAWLTEMNNQCGEPWFSIQRLEVLSQERTPLRVVA